MMKITQVLKSLLLPVVVSGVLLLAPAAASARVFVSVGIAPPAIPVYVQPVAPAYGYIWTPGYWAYDDNGYYWVDGTWVEPPYEGALWTPGYWSFIDGGYCWYPGYWGRTVGYYGGVNYGFGYFGVGFWGGYWNRGHFFYNGEYNHLGFHDHDGFIYRHPVAGFDGRPGGSGFAHGGPASFRRDAIGQTRGTGINGNSFANRGGSFNGAPHNNGYASRGNFGSAPSRNFSGGVQPRSFSGGSGGSAPTPRSFSGGGNQGGAPRSFSGGESHASPGGGGSHGGGGNGGGFHGGGGGHR